MSIFDFIEKRKRNREKKAREQAVKNTAIGAAVGLTVGAAAGILLAPKSGKESREDISKAVKELPDKAKEFIEKAQDRIEEFKGKRNGNKNEVCTTTEATAAVEDTQS